ncbi:hypothetical protein [Ruminococcus flavefaciens]|uniref:Uncharacterized protein n=1 Tax=Ruminococcus flavefaciens TaxID=1265 RepID=A0A1M7G7W8_RUMFL|nr:hypothetical protein [Ruminococcus flavefaciens]SHM12380.1 hypothetical protein SAMN04487860_101117 [Ruminococcus flavefaciens]
MTKIASIAAAAVLLVGSIGGGAYLFQKNGKTNIPEPVLNEVTTGITNTSTTVIGAGTASNGENQPENKFSITKEELIEKVKVNNSFANYFDKFSADYTVLINDRREFHSEPETCIGKVYLDEINLTASATVERYENEKLIGRSLIAIMDNWYYNAEELLAETDFSNGGYKFLETPDKYYYVKDENTDKVMVLPWGRSNNIDVYAPENWDITGEITENGRKILSISGLQKGANNYEGVYRELPYTMKVDAETGMTLSYNLYDNDGNKTYSYELTNYKFDDEAEEFRTAADIIREIENDGYSKHNGF